MSDKIVERTCIVTRNHITPDQAIRLVVSPEGQLLFDLKGNLPAKGYWVTASREHLESLLSNPKRLKQIKNVKEVAEDFIENSDSCFTKPNTQSVGLSTACGAVDFWV